MRCFGRFDPDQALASARPATIAAALDPKPPPMGISLTISSSKSLPAFSPASRANVFQTRLDSSRGISAASVPDAEIFRPPLDGRSVQRRYSAKASASASKPAPRLALEAGTRTRISLASPMDIFRQSEMSILPYFDAGKKSGSP